MRSLVTGLMAGAGLAALAASAAQADAAACAALTAPGLFSDTVVEAAEFMPAGPAGAAGPFGPAPSLPAHCAVTATVSPEPGSQIVMVYRLPADWNGKLLGLGGGGFSGNITPAGAADGLGRGYATMQTDTGHDSAAGGMDASWVANDSDEFDWPKLEDFGHRAIHLMTVTGKEVAAQYYGRAHDLAYYFGCSTGGRQGLMSARRYPADYDGLVAGAPVFDVTTQSSAMLRGRLFSPVENRLNPAQLALVTNAAVAACDAQDGVEDGVIGDPRACDWAPETLICTDGQSPDACLTPAQAGAVRQMYEGVTLADGRVAGQPALPGGETSWMFAGGGGGDPVVAQRRGAALFLDSFEIDPDSLSPEELLDRMQNSRFAGMYDAGDPDLSGLVEQDAKLIIHHGWLDALANPSATADYFDAVVETTGPKIAGEVTDNVRLFMLPGTGHCGGGPGANTADFLTALEEWVEEGRAPDTILARNVAGGFGPPPAAPAGPAMERPLCVWPAQARYDGQGDPNAAASFTCR